MLILTLLASAPPSPPPPSFFRLNLCLIAPNAACKSVSFTVVPQSGPVGTTFDMTYTFTVINQTGAGEIAFGVNPPSGFPFGGGQLETGIAPGTYDVKLQVQAQPNEMEPFSPGKVRLLPFFFFFFFFSLSVEGTISSPPHLLTPTPFFHFPTIHPSPAVPD